MNMKRVMIKLQVLLLVMTVFCTTAIGQTMQRDTMRRSGSGSTTQGTYDRNGRIVGNDSTGRNQRGGAMMTDTSMRRGNRNSDRMSRNGRMEGDTTSRRGGMNYDKMDKKGKMKKDPMKKNNRMKRDTIR
jgi:hypothetical protein